MGGGGKKGGGGGGGVPSFQLPAGVTQGAASETGLGQYGTSLLNPLAAMTGWASSLATGQRVNVPTPGAYAIQAGPQASTRGGNLWNTSFDPTTGLVTYTNARNPGQTWEGDLGQAQSLMQINPAIINQWQQAHQQYQQYQGSGGGGGAGGLGAPMGGIKLPNGTHLTADQVQQYMAATPDQQKTIDQALGQPPGMINALATDPSLGGQTDTGLGAAGPELSQAWQDIQQQQAGTSQMAGLQQQAQQFVTASEAESAKLGALGDTQEQQAQAMIAKADPMYAEAQKLQAQADPMYTEAQKLEAQADPMYNRAQTLESQAQSLYGVGYNELSAADKQIVDANALVKMTTTGEGLFPAQQKMIEQARQSEETQLASTLGGVGLGRSTQLDQLKGAADLASAATAGQLQQGNIAAAEQVVSGALGEQAGAQKTLGLSQTQQAAAQAQYETAQKQVGLGQAEATQAQQQVALGQAETGLAQKQVGLGQTQEQVAQQSYSLQQAADKLTLAGQGLMANEQAQLTTELQNITTQSSGLQKQLWDEAMSGYGTMGQILQGASQSYGYSLSAYSDVLKAMEQHSQTQVGAQEAAQQADQQATSDLFSGLGSLFGQGGAGSSLLGGVGGLLGGGAAAGAGAGAFGTVAGFGTAAASAGAAGSLGALGGVAAAFV